MKRLDALKELAAKVEAGTATFRDFDGWDSVWNVAILTPEEAYQGSLDAAKALHEAVLPPNSTWQYYSGDGHCIVGFGHGPTDYDEAHHDNPARAWLLAILRALIAQEEAHETD